MMTFPTMILLKFVMCAGLAIVSSIICKIFDSFIMPYEQCSTQFHFVEGR